MLKNVADIYPLTGMQQMMLIRALSDRRSPLFVEQLSCTIEGRLDAARVRQAWQRTAERHPALRTAIVWQELDRPLQVVREYVELPFEEHDWRQHSEAQQAHRFAEWSAAAEQHLFDLAQAPLLRLNLFRIAEERYRFYCAAHHILFDGWSLAILVAEVLEMYGALMMNRTFSAPKPAGFREYVNWLGRQDPAAAEKFWRTTLADFHSATPIGFRRPTQTTDIADVFEACSAQLLPEDAAPMKEMLRQRQLTLSTLIHAAWALLLARHSGRRDVVFGTTMSGRPADLPGINKMIGPFINNVPVRVRFGGGQSVAAWLRQVQSSLGELTAYQHTPQTEIERNSELDRHARLFESLVVLENYPRASAEIEALLGLRIGDLQATATTVYPLSLVVLPDDLTLKLRYDRRRLTSAEANDLLAEFVELLPSLASAAEGPLEEFLRPSRFGSSADDPAAPWDFTSQDGTAADTSAPLSSEYVAPLDAVERTLVAIWSELTGRQKVGTHDNFFELGGDSLMAVRLMAEVERQFGRKLPLVWLFQDPTIERLAEVLRSGDQPSACLVPIRPQRAGSRPPLFCAHPAGGTVFCYRELARLLPDDQPLYGLQARGIDGREPPRAKLEEMAADYVAELRKVQPVGPYFLLGWSLGGLIVFEMARQLASRGDRTALVAIIDAGMIRPGETFTEDDFLPMLLQLFPDEVRPTEEELKNLKPEEQLEYFRVRAERARLVAMDDSPIEDQHVFQVFQANMSALLDYRPEPCAGKITLFRAEQDATPMHGERYMGWEPWALGGVEEYRITGDHVNLFREPYITALAAQVGEVLRKACLTQPAPCAGPVYAGPYGDGGS